MLKDIRIWSTGFMQPTSTPVGWTNFFHWTGYGITACRTADFMRDCFTVWSMDRKNICFWAYPRFCRQDRPLVCRDDIRREKFEDIPAIDLKVIITPPRKRCDIWPLTTNLVGDSNRTENYLSGSFPSLGKHTGSREEPDCLRLQKVRSQCERLNNVRLKKALIKDGSLCLSSASYDPLGYCSRSVSWK